MSERPVYNVDSKGIMQMMIAEWNGAIEKCITILESTPDVTAAKAEMRKAKRTPL